MPELKKEIFVCLDCETTGLDLLKDGIVEVACSRFTFSETLLEFESLTEPDCPISEESLSIHRITSAMLVGKPKIATLIPKILDLIGPHTIIGHGVTFDIKLIAQAAKIAKIPCTIEQNPTMDTLRLARHYGDSPNNSLVSLATHFNVPIEESHRAMADVRMNIKVFKHLVSRYHRTEEIFNILSRPIRMKYMPLGKHKGRPFSELPLEYLLRSSHMDFDPDLLFSIRHELKRRKQGGLFQQVTNPFLQL